MQDRRVAIVGAALMTSAMIAIAWIGTRERAPVRDDDVGLGALGAQLLDGAMLDPEGPRATRFRLNGVAVSALAGRSAGTFDRALDVARAACASPPIDPLALAEAMRAPSVMASAPSETSGITSVIQDDRGFVVCLDRASSGAMRYAYARRDPSGVRFVIVWTDAAVRYADLAHADTRGDDVPELPLPDGARRRFSFVREDGRDQMVIYDVHEDPEALERWARDALPSRGWSAPVASGTELGARMLVADRGARRVHLVLRDDGTLVAIAGAHGVPQSPSP
ncbi:hypothetical protein [Sandaracinus amylolyticus]|uniref:hypothetical protein n=1 Tax=Sandaracinus amylolyticus TaxID=927083 RepID=UPI001F33A118|nr:hypothetical protein [Sandaracinus amylolyticus]UJR79090.1 Hypothetical protein I5071_11230 [Sandaracinus amylolyticus]